MKEIKQRLSLLFVTSILGLLAVVFVFFKNAAVLKIHVDLVLVLVILITIILLGFLKREYQRYKTARLIEENKIMHIQVAQIEEGTFDKNSASECFGGFEVLISCFGILLGSKVIKFNIDEIKLKGVQIGHEFISLSYGTDKTTQKIKILHANIGQPELQIIVDRFRYETGVIPLATDL